MGPDREKGSPFPDTPFHEYMYTVHCTVYVETVRTYETDITIVLLLSFIEQSLQSTYCTTPVDMVYITEL